MIIRLPIQTAAAGVRYVAVSLPRIDCLLVDQPGKYLLPENLPAPSKVDSQPIGWQRPYRPISSPRAPSLRFLVEMALRCDSAEEMGKKLKRRFDRQAQRARLAPAGHPPRRGRVGSNVGRSDLAVC